MPRGRITKYSVRLGNYGAELWLELADLEALAEDSAPTLEISKANMQFFEGGLGLYRSSSDSTLLSGYGTMANFEMIYHLVQTEDPVFLGWGDFHGSPERTSWTFSTDGEVVGEGFGEETAGSVVDVLAEALARSVLQSSVLEPSPPRPWAREQSEVTRRLTSAISAIMADPTRPGESSLPLGDTNADRLNADLAGILTHLIDRRF